MIDDIESALSKLRVTAERVAHERDQSRLRFNTETLPGLPQFKTCPVHGIQCELNLDATFESHYRKQNQAVFTPCHRCYAERLALEVFNIPPKYAGAALGDLSYGSSVDCRHLDNAEDYARHPRGFLILLSRGFGCGKTHIATAILQANRLGQFTKHSDMLSAHRLTYKDQSAPNIRKRFKQTALLVIDDLGRVTGGNDGVDLLFSILDHRYAHRKPTIITSNKTLDELSAPADHGGIGGACVDRMREAAFAVCVFSEKSHRPEARQSYLT